MLLPIPFLLLLPLPLCLALTTPSSPPSLYTWDATVLHNLRLSLSSATPPTFPLSQATALQHLYNQTAADLAALSSSSYPSVVSKSSVPPNATLHHFVSLVPYAFPCHDLPDSCHGYGHAPIDLSSCDNSTGLPWQICDGKLNVPARDSMTDRPALEKMMHYVIRLSLAAYVFADRSRAEAAAKLMHTWFVHENTRMLPSLRFAQGIPGLYEGKPSGCIDLSFFGRGFSDAVALLRQTPEASKYWGERQQGVFGKWCEDMAGHMVNDTTINREKNMRNNHGLYYDLTVMSLLSLAGHHPSSSPLLKEMLSPDCEGFVFCIKGRFADQIDDEGRQVHEMKRAGYGHYVHYTLLAHSHLFALVHSIGDVEVKGSAMVKAADWTLGDWKNLTADGGAAWLVYGTQMYRIVARFTGDAKYEKAGCDILRIMRKAKGLDSLWQKERVGMDIWNVALPSVDEECNAWEEMPRLDLEAVTVKQVEIPQWWPAVAAFLISAVVTVVLKMTRGTGKRGLRKFRYRRAPGREVVA